MAMSCVSSHGHPEDGSSVAPQFEKGKGPCLAAGPRSHRRHPCHQPSHRAIWQIDFFVRQNLQSRKQAG